MSAGELTVWEMIGGSEHGWGFQIDVTWGVPPRVVRAGGGSGKMRPLGPYPWAMASFDPASLELIDFRVARNGRRRRLGRGRRVRGTVGVGEPPPYGVFTLWGQVLSGALDCTAAEAAARDFSAEADARERVVEEAARMSDGLARLGHTLGAFASAALTCHVGASGAEGLL